MKTPSEFEKTSASRELVVLGNSPGPVRPVYDAFPHQAIETDNRATAVDAIYVHVPFCTTKCHYCDFYSLAGHLAEADRFLDALEIEISFTKSRLGALRPETIFIGGGTPTLLDPPRLARLLSLITGAIDSSNLREFTIEANPNTFDADRAAALVDHGINRISFGAQSFIPSELRTLQRDHEPDNVAKAFDIARRAGGAGITNLNVDLIFGIPGQTLDSWEYSLTRALELQPQHMSCYSLTYEPNTAMTARMKRGEFAPIDESLELDMFNHVYQRMRNAGFTRYEISNYARTGENGNECRHNIHYWKGGNWLAWGPSAAAHLNGWRWKNVGSLAHYLEALLPPSATPLLPLTQMEHLTPTHWAGEVATFWMRLSDGINYAEFAERTGVDARPRLEKALKKYADMGFVELLPTHARLLEKAVPVSNTILRDTLAAFD
ncbi:MAG TPA: radical SAM family heme chaperone HemW [Phycisphaerae bacterium]|nr:radical SAM family heme chaperone HemW [Phycisphaerae bacterium]